MFPPMFGMYYAPKLNPKNDYSDTSLGNELMMWTSIANMGQNMNFQFNSWNNGGFMALPYQISGLINDYAQNPYGYFSPFNNYFNMPAINWNNIGAMPSMQGMPGMSGLPGLSSSSSSSSKNNKVAVLKKVLEDYKKEGANSDEIGLIDKALEKTGEEREKALKEAYNHIFKGKSDKVKDVIYRKYENELNALGIKVKGNEINNETYKSFKASVNCVVEDFNKSDTEWAQIALYASENSDNILGFLSVWNDEYSDKHIIEKIKDEYNNCSGSEQNKNLNNKKSVVKKLSDALISKADDFDEDEYPNLYASVNSLKNKLKDVYGTDGKSFNVDKLDDLAKAFDNLYAHLRMAEAQELDKKIKNEYGCLNDFSDNTVKDFVTDDTKADLENEGIKIKDSDLDKHNAGNTGNTGSKPATIQELITQNNVKKVRADIENLYEINGEPKKYYIIEGDTILEIKNVEKIEDDGKIKIKGQENALTIEEIKNNSDLTTTVTVENVSNYYKVTDALYKNTKKEKENVWKSKFPNEKGEYTYYTIKDNELHKITSYDASTDVAMQVSEKVSDLDSMAQISNAEDFKDKNLTDCNISGHAVFKDNENKYYIIKNNKLEEIPNAKNVKNDGTIEFENGESIKLTASTTMEDISEKANFDELAVANMSRKEKIEYYKKHNNAKGIGETVAACLKGNTSKADRDAVVGILDHMGTEAGKNLSVADFIIGYSKFKTNNNGIVEQMASECSAKYKYKHVRTLILRLMEEARTAKLTDSEHYQKLNELYEDRKTRGAEEKLAYFDWTWSWLGRIVQGDWFDDVDVELEALAKEIQEKKNTTTSSES